MAPVPKEVKRPSLSKNRPPPNSVLYRAIIRHSLAHSRQIRAQS